jgi:hypothetical protein
MRTKVFWDVTSCSLAELPTLQRNLLPLSSRWKKMEAKFFQSTGNHLPGHVAPYPEVCTLIGVYFHGYILYISQMNW